MSKQLLFSALIGVPTSVVLALNRYANDSWWAVMWVTLAALHVWIIAGELRAKANQEQGHD